MRYLLSEHSAAILRALGAARGGVSFEDRRIASPPGVPKLMPFDVRLAPGGEGHEDETHAYCYVPDSAPLVVACNGALLPGLQVLSGQTLDSSTGWLDCGEVSPGQYVVLSGIVSTTAYGHYGHAAPLYASAKYCLSISDYPTTAPAPTGYELAYALIPQRSIAQCGPNGLRQLFHGVYQAEADFGDDSLTGTAWTSSDIRTLSVSNMDYEGSPGVVSVHGFRQPTTISNPYDDGGTPPANPDEFLVLVRVLSADGKTAEMKYLPLGLLAAGDGSGGGGYTPPQELQDVIDDYDERIQIPCPSDGNGDVALWDPCAQQWKSGRTMADVLSFILAAKFWPVYGDHTKCKGSSIGDSSGNQAIDLDNRVLNCDGNNGNGVSWETNGHFSAAGQISAGGDIVARGSLVSFQSVILVDEQNSTIRHFMPTQITVGTQTLTVLAE